MSNNNTTPIVQKRAQPTLNSTLKAPVVEGKPNSGRTLDRTGHDQSQQPLVKRSIFRPSSEGVLLMRSVLYGTAATTISVAELLNPSAELNSIPENKLKITLQPKDLQDLNLLLALLPNQLNIDFFDKITTLFSDQPGTKPKMKFSEGIIGLDLSKISINKNTNGPINTLLTAIIVKNPNFMPNLINLTIGNVQADFILPDGLNNLKVLTIGNFEDIRLSITLPNGLNNLETLTMGDIRTNVKLPSDLDNLTTLTIGDIWDRITLTLPNSFRKLNTLVIGNIWANNFILPNDLNNLSTLTISHIGASFKLKSWLNNLTTLTIGDIASKCNLMLSDDLDYNITTFIIGKVWGTLTLPPNSLSNLKILSIDFIGEANILKLPNDLHNLTTLTIRDLAGTIILPSSLAKLSTLIIGEFRTKAVLNLPNNLNDLATLTIGNIYNDASLELSISLNSLTTLTISAIGKHVTLKFPLILNNLKTLTIGAIGQTIVTPTQEMEADRLLTDLILENTPGTTIELPDSLPSLTNIQVGTIHPGSNLKLPILIDLKLTLMRVPPHVRVLIFFLILALGVHYIK